MLTKDQERLLWHLSNFSIADRDTCLMFLSNSERKKPEYGLRTLMRREYVTQRKDGLYGITVKGLGYLGKEECWLSCGGNREARKRLAKTSRTAALLIQCGINLLDAIPQNGEAGFIPSPIWRKTREGITSTARFNGILFQHGKRLVVYHIGDGNMDWQTFAERSLFFQNYGKYDDRATGMLLICDDGRGPEIGQNIIRETMYRRNRFLANPGGSYYETDKPQKYAHAPIRLHDQYSRAFLTEEQDLHYTLETITLEEEIIEKYCRCLGGSVARSKDFWDIEVYPKRIIVNPANDLFKYLYLFAHLRDSTIKSNIRWELPMQKKYASLAAPYEQDIEVWALWEKALLQNPA